MGISYSKNRPKFLADRVLDNISKGQAPNISAEARKLGYSLNTIKASLPQKTEAFRSRIAERIDRANAKAVKLMEKQRQMALEAMPAKMKRAGYRDLAYATDILTKNHRLLTNQSTENIDNKGAIVMLPSAESESDTEKTA